jgi:hypothetical protein
MEIIKHTSFSTKGFQLKNIDVEWGSSVYVTLECYDFWSDSYRDWGLGDTNQVFYEIRKDGCKYTNEEVFIDICKIIKDFSQSHSKVHESLLSKIGKYARKNNPNDWVVYYLAAKIRNEIGKEFLSKPLLYYFNQIKKN